MPGWNRTARKFVTALALAVCAGGAARADTIILKNGRKIVAEKARHENGKVICETRAGRLELPESLVLRIEAGDMPSAPETTASASLQQLAPSSFVGGAEDAGAVIRDGSIDREVLARLDAAAGSGADAAARAAAGESAATRFEFDRGEIAAALGHAERALSFEPNEPKLLVNVAYLHIRRGEFAAAFDFLNRAGRIAPDMPEVARLAGWAHYGLNRLPQAVEQWQRAQAIAPNDDVAKALAKAKLDIETGRNFRENQSPHFTLHYYGEAAPELAGEVIGALENDFADLSGALAYTPTHPIAVWLYTNQAFADITQAPSWIGALNDGQLRIPVQGLQTVTPQLAAVLKHELTHSFINEKTHGHAPVWLQEGLAQWMEGRRSGTSIAALMGVYEVHQDPSLSVLEGNWLNFPPEVARVAYAWSLAVAEMIEAGDSSDVNRILDLLAADTQPPAAVNRVLHMDYGQLNDATGAYLRRTYGSGGY